jgi:8-oxo-dGTP diphosphatase
VAIYLDPSGRRLDEYPRPSVAVDTAVLTVTPDPALAVLLVQTDGGWRLPGTFLHERETLAQAVLRSLRTKAGVEGLSPRQLHVFDEPDRDDRGWVLSVAHRDAVPVHRLDPDESLARITPLTSLPPLPYGHEDILKAAVATLRDDYAYSPDPSGLIPEPFTLRDLQRVHEAVAGTPLRRDTFRRTMEPQLRATGETLLGAVGKPPRLFVRD